MARRGRPQKLVLCVSEEQRVQLQQLAKRGRTKGPVAFRARIVLGCSDGSSNSDVARRLRTTDSTVAFWRTRFVERGLEALEDEPRPGAPRKHGDEKIEAVIKKTLQTIPKGATHWSTRNMAANMGLSQSTVGRIWRAFGLRPHRSEVFQLSSDPLFIEKVRDVVGLYMAPPTNALVLCVDEKSQIQALNRTQPMLPMRPGQAERHTPEYKRNGTTSLFAALDVATGNVVGKCFNRHRSIEFRKFLDLIDSGVPNELDVHIILDNYATHKTALVRRWLQQHPRYHLHFTPTHSSWLNQVERWFGLLTQRQIKRGSHHNVDQLKRAITEFISTSNDQPKPFKWTKSADEILNKIRRFAEKTLVQESQPNYTGNQ